MGDALAAWKTDPQVRKARDRIMAQLGFAGGEERAPNLARDVNALCEAVAKAGVAETGPGSASDERKALLQLVAAMPALTPTATGLSHASASSSATPRGGAPSSAPAAASGSSGLRSSARPGTSISGSSSGRQYASPPDDESDREQFTRYADAARDGEWEF